MAPRIYSSSRDRLLDAAERLLVAGGLAGFSVESVAAAAGVSKGAFFHHFKTKDAMLLAVLDRFVAGIESRIAARAAADPERQGALLRAQLDLALDEADDLPRGFVLALMQAAQSQPSFRQRSCELTSAAIARYVSDGVPEGAALVLQLALDGLALWALLGFNLDARRRRALRETLSTLARPDARAGRPRKKTMATAARGKRT